MKRVLFLMFILTLSGCLSTQARTVRAEKVRTPAVTATTDTDVAVVATDEKHVVIPQVGVTTENLTPEKAADAANQVTKSIGSPAQDCQSEYMVNIDSTTGEVTNVPAEKISAHTIKIPRVEAARTWFGYGILFFGCALPHLIGKTSWRTKVLRALLVATVCLVLFILVTGCQTVNPASGVKPPTTAGNTTPANKVVQTALNLPWLITTSILGIAGGVTGALFLPGPLKLFAVALAAFCAISMGLTILVSQYALYVVIGTAVLCLGVGAYAVANVKKAIPELIQTVDLCKSKLDAEVREHLFGGGNTLERPGLVRDKVQSPTTEAIIAAVRGKTA